MAAEEKKKPDLKARLNKTMVGQAPPAGGAAPAPTAAADAASEMPVAAVAPAAPAGDDDLVVPEFIKQQMAEKAAAEARAAEEARRRVEEADRRAAAEEAAQRRAAAIAADPFSASGSPAAASPADFHIVVDEKPVDDAEVGRKRTGSIIAVAVTGVIALTVGYLGGNQSAEREQAARTTAAVTEVRRQVDAAGAIISTMKEKVDHAATAARIPAANANSDDPPAPAAAQAGAPTVDPELATWFQALPSDPPLSPETYAGRVGRLRPDLVQKLMKVQIELQEAFFQLRRHSELSSGPQQALITASIGNLVSTRAEMSRLMVVFGPGGNGGPPVMGNLVFAQPAPGEGQFTITPAIPGTPPTRGIYTAGDLAAAATIRTVGVPVAMAGVPQAITVGSGRPFQDYQTRLRAIRGLVDQLVTDHRALAEALNH